MSSYRDSYVEKGRNKCECVNAAEWNRKMFCECVWREECWWIWFWTKFEVMQGLHMFYKQLGNWECVKDLKSVLRSFHIKMKFLCTAGVHWIFERQNNRIEAYCVLSMHLKDPLRHIFRAPPSRVSGFVGRGGAGVMDMTWVMSCLTNSQVMLLLLLVWRLHFDNH